MQERVLHRTFFLLFEHPLWPAANSPHYHYQRPPLSAITGVSACTFSDRLSEAGGGAAEGGPACVWRLYVCTKASRGGWRAWP